MYKKHHLHQSRFFAKENPETIMVSGVVVISVKRQLTLITLCLRQGVIMILLRIVMTHKDCRSIAILNDLWYSKFNELEFIEKKN